jgi:hypothetical protein
MFTQPLKKSIVLDNNITNFIVFLFDKASQLDEAYNAASSCGFVVDCFVVA